LARTPASKAVTAIGQGTWKANDDGTVQFTAEGGFTGTPAPMEYTIADSNGQVSELGTLTATFGM
jgi:large repetitive protein